MTGRRELHLHVGLNKTGTTYLQKCLDLNRDWFAVQDFEMGPGQNANGAHHELAWLAQDAGAEALADVLRQARGDRLLVSSEAFADLLVRPDAAAALHAALAPAFDVTLYVVLRRQDFLKESAYAEVVKTTRRLGPLRVEPDPALAGRLSLFDDPDLDRRLGIMEGLFGRANVRVGVYHDGLRRDPLAQFCALLGVGPAPEARPEKEFNVSLPRRKTMLLANFRKDDPQLAAEILAAARRSRRIAVDAPKFLLSPADRRRLVERYREGNRRILERHAPEDGAWLLEPPPDDPAWFPAAPIRPAEFAAFGASLVRGALRRPGRPLGARLRAAARFASAAAEAAWHARRTARA